MSNVRLRRLQADHDALRRLAHLHPRISIEGVSGNPPDRYRLVMRVRSLRERGDAIEPIDEHRLEIRLPLGYPRDAPLFRMLTPVFHPNIAPHAICIGDDWSAGESLDMLVQRVGELLAFQSYNIKSPLNGRAARWVEEHPDRVPVERDEFFVDLAAAPPLTTAAAACANCGAPEAIAATCAAAHPLCPDCALRCHRCASVICLVCGDRPCASAADACCRVSAA